LCLGQTTENIWHPAAVLTLYAFRQETVAV